VTGGSNHRFLNLEGRWAGFERRGLELRDNGVLRLRSLPRLAGQPPALADLSSPTGPAGVAEVPGGHVYFTDPDGDRLWLSDGCDGTQRPAPGDFSTPRGLAFHARRRELLAAEAGRGRILLFALPGLELSEVWDGREEPGSLACSPDGRTYVVDAATGQVVALDVLGRPSSLVWGADQVAAAEVAVAGTLREPLVVVLDAGGHVHVLNPEGRRVEHWDSGLAEPLGLGASGRSVFIGDQAARRLAVFDLDGVRAGYAYGYSGSVAAVATGPDGDLLVHPGDAVAPLRLEMNGACGTRGVLWGGPFRNPSDRSDPRHLLRARVELPEGAHVRLHYAQGPPGTGGGPPPVDDLSELPFADPRWRCVEPDAPETLFSGEPLDSLWVGMTFASEGLASPEVSQIRVDFDHDTWLTHLPAVYQRDSAPGDVLARWLTLFESAFDGVHDAIEGLPRLFDPDAAPAAWLPSLAEWLAAEAPEGWDSERSRELIAASFANAGRRGTLAGLRDALRRQARVEVVVEEPIVQAGWWVLPGDESEDAQAAMSVLGSGTMLAVGEPSGAVVGSSAVLDGSFLSPQDRFATALFSDVAHQFSLRVYRGASYSEDALATVRAVVDAERPAHTAYHLCVVEPRMRVGYQARVGVDAVVADPAEPDPGDAAREGGLLLGGEPAGRLGTTSELGRTHLTNLAPRRNDAAHP
jgi:phage tail-like protein